jgi:hypothetical protein
MIHGGMTIRHDMSHFWYSVWERVLEGARQIADSLAQADVAWREMKALEQIHMRFIECGVGTRIEVLEPGRASTRADLNIGLFVNRSLQREESFRIRRGIDRLNRRYGTSIRLLIVTEEGRGGKETRSL